MRNSHFRSFALSIAVLLASPFPAPAAAPPASTAPAPALFTDQDPLFSAAQSLQHWWPADGHSLDLVAHRHAALKDGATFAPGRVGQAFTFDGLRNYVDCGTANPSTPADAFTFMLWFRAERQTGWQYLAFCWGDSGMDVNINDSQPDIVAGQLGLGVGYEDSWRKTWNNAAASFKPTDQWHHVALTFDSRKIQLFRDGTLAKETP